MEDYRSYIDGMREYWKQHPYPIDPKQYLEGWPKPVATKKDGSPIFVWIPWKEDMAPYALAAASAMKGTCEYPFPYDVCDFAYYLRRARILETLGFPVDPEGVNIVRQIEYSIPEDKRNTQSISEAVAGFLLNMEKIRKATPEDVENIKKQMQEGNATYLDTEHGGAMKLDYSTDFWENDSKKEN